ncbi:MAG: proteasome subunit alpha, partial [Actinomycetota bacterium]|nr:proteasome subunit alpha [Actinomycetota bacterium]
QNLPLADAIAVAVKALGSVGAEAGAVRELAADSLEVAVLDRNRGTRKFRRIAGAALTSLLPVPTQPAEPAAAEATAVPPVAGSAPVVGSAPVATETTEPAEPPQDSTGSENS